MESEATLCVCCPLGSQGRRITRQRQVSGDQGLFTRSGSPDTEVKQATQRVSVYSQVTTMATLHLLLEQVLPVQNLVLQTQNVPSEPNHYQNNSVGWENIDNTEPLAQWISAS